MSDEDIIGMPVDPTEFDMAVTDLLNAELAKNSIHAIVTGYVIVCECDRVDGEGSDFIAGFEAAGQRKTVTFGLLEMYQSMRKNEEFIGDMMARSGLLDRLGEEG